MFVERTRYETHLGTGVHRVDAGAAAGGAASKFFIYSLRAVGPWLLSGAENGGCFVTRRLGGAAVRCVHVQSVPFRIWAQTQRPNVHATASGWLAFHDLRPEAAASGPVGTCSYALGANMAAVTTIEATRDGKHLVAAGDDGKGMVYHW